MNAYVFQAALLCEECGRKVRECRTEPIVRQITDAINRLQAVETLVNSILVEWLPSAVENAHDAVNVAMMELELLRATVVNPDERKYDSDDFPKGPYAGGGGEADHPQHCDQCGLFLQNSLTAEGAAYVRYTLAREFGRASNSALDAWREFYRALL